jgi:cytochrome P450
VITVEFNPNDPANLEDPYPTYYWLREEAPLYHNADQGFWALSRYRDVETAARNHSVFSSGGGVELEVPGWLYGPGSFINSDPPWHDVLRKVVGDRFTPRRISDHTATIRQTVAKLLRPMLERHTGDIAVEVARELPVQVIAEMLGVPEDDRPMVCRWHNDFYFDRDPGELAMTANARDALPRIAEYFRALAQDRRSSPRGDLISDLVVRGLEGPWADAMDEVLRGLVFLLFSAGSETTHSLIGTMFLLLETHPEIRELIAKDPSKIPALVEETVRFDSPVQHLARTTTDAVDLYGETIPSGDRVLLLFGSANRDDRHWPAADSFDPMRRRQHHLGFGVGIHFCLGAPLARLEGRLVLEEFFAHVVDYEIAGPVIRSTRGTNRGLQSLQIRW